MWLGQRTATTVEKMFKNAAQVGSTDASDTNTGALNQNLAVIGEISNTGALVNASSDRIMAAIIGGGGISAQNVSNRLNSFATAYGINSF